MRIAYVCVDPGIPVLGSKGASVHVQQIVRAFQRRGDEVTVYCTRVGDGERELLGGAEIVHVTVPRGDTAERERAVAAAAEAIAERVIADGADLVYERYSLFSDAAARTGLRSVVEVNAPLIQEQTAYRHLADEQRATALTRSALSGASTVVCVSGPVADWARAHGAPAAHVTPNGVDTAAFTPVQRWDDSVLRVAFVGSLKPWHGVDAAIDALAGVTGVELTVIGDGPARAELEQRADEVGLAVRWIGAVPHPQIAALLSEAHVGLAPYPADAGDYFSPLKVYEYLAAGMAVVASDTGQLPSIIAPERTGLLVRPGDRAVLRDAVVRLRDDRALAQRLGDAGRRTAMAEHDWDRTLERILSTLPAPVTAAVTEAEGVLR